MFEIAEQRLRAGTRVRCASARCCRALIDKIDRVAQRSGQAARTGHRIHRFRQQDRRSASRGSGHRCRPALDGQDHAGGEHGRVRRRQSRTSRPRWRSSAWRCRPSSWSRACCPRSVTCRSTASAAAASPMRIGCASPRRPASCRMRKHLHRRDRRRSRRRSCARARGASSASTAWTWSWSTTCSSCRCRAPRRIAPPRSPRSRAGSRRWRRSWRCR